MYTKKIWYGGSAGKNSSESYTESRGCIGTCYTPLALSLARVHAKKPLTDGRSNVIESLFQTINNVLFKALASESSLISMSARSNRPSSTSRESITNIFCCPRDRRGLPGNQPGGHQHQDTDRLLRECVSLIDFYLPPSPSIE